MAASFPGRECRAASPGGAGKASATEDVGGTRSTKQQSSQAAEEDGEPLELDDSGGIIYDFQRGGAMLSKHIPENNVGYKLLLKMGWSRGTGLGRKGEGRVDPVPLSTGEGHMGLGRWKMELGIAEDTTKSRKLLETEIEETAEVVERRERSAQRELAIKEELAEVNKVFRCDLCNKQYTKVADMDNHLQSYDHHHTKRMKETRERERARTQGDANRRREREQEKEMKRLMEQAAAAEARLAASRTGCAPSGAVGAAAAAATGTAAVRGADGGVVPGVPGKGGELKPAESRAALSFGFKMGGSKAKSKKSFGFGAKK